MADSVRIVLLDKTFTRVLVVSEKPPDDPTEFKLPGGKIDQNETPLAAAHREFAEELGSQAADAATLTFAGQLTNDDGTSARYIFVANNVPPETIAPGPDIAAIKWIDKHSIPPNWKNHGHITSAIKQSLNRQPR